MEQKLPYAFRRGAIAPTAQATLHTDSEAFKFGNVVVEQAVARWDEQEASGRSFEAGMMLNWRCKVAEYTDACVFFVRKGRVIAPNLNSDILESITRDTLIELLKKVRGIEVEEREVDLSEMFVLDEACQGDTVLGLTATAAIDDVQGVHGIQVQEREIDRTELYLAEEMWGSASGTGIFPIIKVDGRQIGDGGPGSIFRALRKTFHAVHNGSMRLYPEWRTPVF